MVILFYSPYVILRKENAISFTNIIQMSVEL
jgi:hypothetical protein